MEMLLPCCNEDSLDVPALLLKADILVKITDKACKPSCGH